jgi:hypothetical protein
MTMSDRQDRTGLSFTHDTGSMMPDKCYCQLRESRVVIVAHVYVMSCTVLFYSILFCIPDHFPLIHHRDRYVLKLFRDYMFHQALSDGAPVLDAGESSMFMIMIMIIVRNGGGTGTSDGVYCVCFQPTSHPPIGLRGTLTTALTAPVMLHHYNTLIIILLISSSDCPSVHRLLLMILLHIPLSCSSSHLISSHRPCGDCTQQTRLWGPRTGPLCLV